MDKNLTIKVVENCDGYLWWFSLYKGSKELMEAHKKYKRKGNAIRAAKRISEQIGITYNPKIKQLHGC